MSDSLQPRGPATPATYSMAARISTRVVQILLQYTGRGPTTARTTLNANFAVVVLEGALTKGERSLVTAGEEEAVRSQRRAFQRLMEREAVEAVEEITGRRVRACLSDVAPEHGLAVELFLFEAIPETGEAIVAEVEPGREGLHAA